MKVRSPTYPSSVRVNGKEILDSISRIVYRAGVGEISSATIEVLTPELAFDGVAHLEINTRDGIEAAICQRAIDRRLRAVYRSTR